MSYIILFPYIVLFPIPSRSTGITQMNEWTIVPSKHCKAILGCSVGDLVCLILFIMDFHLIRWSL